MIAECSKDKNYFSDLCILGFKLQQQKMGFENTKEGENAKNRHIVCLQII